MTPPAGSYVNEESVAVDRRVPECPGDEAPFAAEPPVRRVGLDQGVRLGVVEHAAGVCGGVRGRRDASDSSCDSGHREHHRRAVTRHSDFRAIIVLPLDRDFLDGVAEASRDGNDLAVPRKALLAALRQHRLPERGRATLAPHCVSEMPGAIVSWMSRLKALPSVSRRRLSRWIRCDAATSRDPIASTELCVAAATMMSSWSSGVDRSTSQKPASGVRAVSSPARTAAPFPRCGLRMSRATGPSGACAIVRSTSSCVPSTLPSSTKISSLPGGCCAIHAARRGHVSANRSTSLYTGTTIDSASGPAVTMTAARYRYKRATRAVTVGGVRRLLLVLLAVALAGIWPLYRSAENHSFTAIIGAGVVGPSTPLLAREVPDLAVTQNAGHDGQQFYAVARHPFRPACVSAISRHPDVSISAHRVPIDRRGTRAGRGHASDRRPDARRPGSRGGLGWPWLCLPCFFGAPS